MLSRIAIQGRVIIVAGSAHFRLAEVFVMDTQPDWDKIYSEKEPNAVSWYRPHLEKSLSLIERMVAERSASIIDIGGGESTLVDDLLARGYQSIAVLDISQVAIDANRIRLGLV